MILENLAKILDSR